MSVVFVLLNYTLTKIGIGRYSRFQVRRINLSLLRESASPRDPFTTLDENYGDRMSEEKRKKETPREKKEYY